MISIRNWQKIPHNLNFQMNILERVIFKFAKRIDGVLFHTLERLNHFSWENICDVNTFTLSIQTAGNFY